mmetsp:Transcript_11923/g.22081  ORF Transcript_11923/g.22081 Transcript_11923/m.22081 type:complete len:95 (-) Transcript_11923:199-483(-)
MARIASRRLLGYPNAFEHSMQVKVPWILRNHIYSQLIVSTITIACLMMAWSTMTSGLIMQVGGHKQFINNSFSCVCDFEGLAGLTSEHNAILKL